MDLEQKKKSNESKSNPQDGVKVTKILSRKEGSSESVGNTSSFNMRDALNSEPFIPKGPQVVLSEEESNRTQFKPPIKILPREKNGRSSNSSAGSANSDGKKGSQFGKTLEEREAEYNEARKRILGSPCSSTGTGSTGVTPTTSPCDAGNQTRPSTHPPNGSVKPPPSSSRPPLLGEYPANVRPSVPTVRNPIGPDGATRGFKR